MNIGDSVQLTRDVEAVMVPVGDRVTLQHGETATLTQDLGGYTVIVNRLGSSPLDQASVVAVRPGPNFSRTDTLSAVTTRTVYVDVK